MDFQSPFALIGTMVTSLWSRPETLLQSFDEFGLSDAEGAGGDDQPVEFLIQGDRPALCRHTAILRHERAPAVIQHDDPGMPEFLVGFHR